MDASTFIPVRDFARALCGRAAENPVYAVLTAYLDDSGTHADSPVAVLGGLLGVDLQWSRFERDWKNLLDEPLPGKPALKKGFHLVDCKARDGEFESYNEAERDHVTYLFRQVILSHRLLSVAYAVDAAAWRDLIVGDVARILDNAKPIQCCMVKTVETLVSLSRQIDSNEKLTIVLDQGTQPDLNDWGRFIVTAKTKYPQIAGVGFGFVSDILPLQGADMIATESFYFGQEWLKNPENPKARAHFRDFLRRDVSAGFILDRKKVAEIVHKIRAIGRLEP